MATDGLSLVGFITEQQTALNHLRFDCVPANPSDAALIPIWQAAQTVIGAPCNQIPAAMGMPPVSFQFVYIDALLAHQIVVDDDWIDQHCGTLSKPPTEAEPMTLSATAQTYVQGLLAQPWLADRFTELNQMQATVHPPLSDLTNDFTGSATVCQAVASAGMPICSISPSSHSGRRTFVRDASRNKGG